MTYTVVARAGSLVGAATCSHSPFLATKTLHVCSRQEAPAIVVSQAFSSQELGRAALADLADGRPARLAGSRHAAADPDAELRQLLVADRSAVWATTGSGCIAEAGDARDAGDTAAVAGNMLTDATVLPAMASAAAAQHDAPLVERLLTVLAAGHGAGGDFRGDRSAALVVVGDELPVRLTVDDHDDPVAELTRLATAFERDRIIRRCMAWLTSGDDADSALVAAVDQHLAAGSDDGEAWRLLLDGAAAADASRPRVARLVAALDRVRERGRHGRRDQGGSRDD